jgi:putative membrane protein
MKRHFSFLSVLCLLFCMTACNNGNNKDAVEKADSANDEKANASNDSSSRAQTTAMPVDEKTSDFMVKVADGGMAEVELGKLAQEKAKNERVKSFAAMMVQDHSQANDELKGLASQKNVTLPAAVGDDHKKHKDDLSKKNGRDFDKAYMKMMVDDHQKTIDKFEDASKNSNDADVKAWVDKTLPKLRMHLDSAKAINSSLK